jgi:hypothetical protein
MKIAGERRVIGEAAPAMWSAGTCQGFKRVTHSLAFDGDKSPAESADKSAHSKASRAHVSRFGLRTSNHAR